MSIREQLFGAPSEPDTDESTDTQEQLAAEDVDPRGRQNSGGSGFVTSYINSVLGRDEASRTYNKQVGVDVSVPQRHINTRYQEYVQTTPLVKAPLSIFGDAVSEPGWQIEATVDGEPDEDMTDALEEWGQNCYIHAREPGHDIVKLVEEIPERRRGKGTLFIEKAGTRGDSESIGGLMMLDPASVKVYSRENQPILIQPDDDVPADHPTTDDGRAAAYVQYDNDLAGFDDKDPVAFAADEIIKITYDPQEGSAFGTPLWVTIRENIDRLEQLLRDREASIRINGHPWRIISNENWTYQEASKFLKKHFEGDVTHWSESQSKEKNSFVGRMDAIPHEINVDEHTGDIPDIDDAVMDEVQAIFSIMPVSRFQISYEEDINQFVVEPQKEKDERAVDKEQNLIREYLEPVFREKADELAPGDEYEGEVSWQIAQPRDENPLNRDSFDADAYQTMVKPLLDAGAPLSVAFNLAGIDREEFEDEFAAEELELDEDDEQVQAQFEASQGTEVGGEEVDGEEPPEAPE